MRVCVCVCVYMRERRARTPFVRSRASQNGSVMTRSDTDSDAAHMRKAPGVMQMRQTRQMQSDEDACIKN